jgi:transposase
VLDRPIETGNPPAFRVPNQNANRFNYFAASPYAWKKQLQDQAARAFDPGVGRDGEPAHEREIERLHAKIGHLTVERDFLARRSGR